jgi:hypothetical protein
VLYSWQVTDLPTVYLSVIQSWNGLIYSGMIFNYMLRALASSRDQRSRVKKVPPRGSCQCKVVYDCG